MRVLYNHDDSVAVMIEVVVNELEGNRITSRPTKPPAIYCKSAPSFSHDRPIRIRMIKPLFIPFEPRT